MNLTYFKNKSACVFLAFIFFFQSCSIYRKGPITIDEAVETHREIRILTNDNKKIILKKIEKTDTAYYGLTNIRGQMMKIPIQQNQIQEIQPINKGASRFVTIASIVTGVVVIATVVLLIDFSNDLDEWGNSTTK